MLTLLSTSIFQLESKSLSTLILHKGSQEQGFLDIGYQNPYSFLINIFPLVLLSQKPIPAPIKIYLLIPNLMLFPN
jgi:hypothetical protein